MLSCVHAGRKCKNFPEEGRYSLPLSTAVSPNAILRAISPFVSVNFRAGSSQKPFAVHNRERAEESHDVGGKDFRSRDSGHVCSRQIFLWVPWERGPNERRTLCCAVESSWKVRRARENILNYRFKHFCKTPGNSFGLASWHINSPEFLETYFEKLSLSLSRSLSCKLFWLRCQTHDPTWIETSETVDAKKPKVG